MARVFLLNPPTAETVRSPLLSFCYLAASLRRAGHEVALLDASAPFAPRQHAGIVERALAFAPDLVGIHCKTLYVHDAYSLAKAFANRGVPLACGGPHPTVMPHEPLSHGFDFSIVGEAEESLVELASALDDRAAFPRVRSKGFQLDLDALASPLDALDLFDPSWYGAKTAVPPAGLLSSRGCPAACTFCSNNVTGRRFRYRSAQSIAAEIEELHARTGMAAFSFFDDSFAVGRRRVDELCEALARVRPRPQWTCTAHPSHLDRHVLSAMKSAGCCGVDIGMESGDPAMLLRIGKGVTTDRVLQVLEDARSLGLHCMLNLMFGWPDETLEELQRTLDFMDLAAPLAAAFNARGVLVPYPGTAIYHRNHEKYAFTDWWLQEPIDYRPFPSTWSRNEIERAYAADAALERNFFHHSPRHLELIQEGLTKKARLTLDKATHTTPKLSAAGAR